MSQPDDPTPYVQGQPQQWTPTPAYPVSQPAIPSAQPYAPAPYGQQQYPVVVAGPPTSGWAVTSLVFGILGVLGGFCLFGIPCVIAVICGHAGLRDTNGGVKGGRGMAQAGLVLGYLVVGPAIFLGVTGVGSSFFQ